jgi:RNA polymerase sigma-70 factor (ECF subfamily)
VDEPVQSVDVFEAERPRLLGLAYRILGSAVDAEDVVQEAWVRWQAAHDVERPAAWLTTVVSRLALDAWRAQQRKREDYVGPWLPEPVATEPDPADRAEMADSLTFGFLVLLDELSAIERVVFLLADVFGEPFVDIAATVGKSEAACRQIASRARRKLQDSKPHGRVGASPSLAVALLNAVAQGDVAATMALLDPEVVLTSDGGPHRHAARRPVIGADRVTRLLVNITKRGFDFGAEMQFADVNRMPALVISRRGRPQMMVAIETADDRVQAIRIVVNPEKLGHLAEPLKLI